MCVSSISHILSHQQPKTKYQYLKAEHIIESKGHINFLHIKVSFLKGTGPLIEILNIPCALSVCDFYKERKATLATRVIETQTIHLLIQGATECLTTLPVIILTLPY